MIDESIRNLSNAFCVECDQEFNCDRDIQLCDDCIELFDLDKLWKQHDNNELDALDFNESETMREQFRNNVMGVDDFFELCQNLWETAGNATQLDEECINLLYFKIGVKLPDMVEVI